MRATHSQVACLSLSGRLLVFKLDELKLQPKGGRGLTLMDVDAKDPLVSVATCANAIKVLGAGRGGKAKEEDTQGRLAGGVRRQAGAQGQAAGRRHEAAQGVGGRVDRDTVRAEVSKPRHGRAGLRYLRLSGWSATTRHDPALIRAAAQLESPWAPLRQPVFRMLWSVWLTANICMWMNDVAAAWMMTSLTTSPMMVALVQSASTLPVFFLGMPSGALADILDRRKYFIFTQFWVATVGVLMCLVTLSGQMVAPLLLLLTFANGIGLAMRWPVFSAVIPELIPKAQLPAALALNGIAMNTSRIFGPILAGALIAGLGSAYVFALNAVLSVICGFVIMRWRTEPKVSALPAERFFGAIRVGVRYVRESVPMRAILLRITRLLLAGDCAHLAAAAGGQADAGRRRRHLHLAAGLDGLRRGGRRPGHAAHPRADGRRHAGAQRRPCCRRPRCWWWPLRPTSRWPHRRWCSTAWR